MSNTRISADGLRKFCIGWRQLVEEYAGDNYLCEHFPSQCGDGYPIYYSEQAVQSKLYIEYGDLTWPVTGDAMPADLVEVINLVEFVFQHISKPTDGWFHSWCGATHPTAFDARTARYEYTVAVNKMFRNFGLPLLLKKGRAVRITSVVLDRPVLELELATSDKHLVRLLNTAISDFQTGNRHHALRTIVDAFERIKTVHSPDKRKSVKRVVESLSPEEEVQRAFDEDLRRLTQIANGFCIRHHEVDKIPIDDDDMVEFLFYLYFNYVRFILKKHQLLGAG